MANNPYTPPTADVTERAESSDAAPPRTVIQAVWMLWVSLALGVVEIVLTGDQSARRGESFNEHLFTLGAEVAIMALFLGAYLWVVQNVRRGRNWARFAILILTALGIVGLLTSHRRVPPVVFALNLLDTLLDIIAVALIFRPPASPWFGRARR